MTSCDCCGAYAWEYLFSEAGLDLGRCVQCGLHYVAQIPNRETRMTEMEAGHFADGQVQANAGVHRRNEAVRHEEFLGYVETARQFAPAGRWLDIGCGTGLLIMHAKAAGRKIEGIELTPDRRAVARQATGAIIHEQPIEHLPLDPESFAAVTLINVFSHLTCPSETLGHIRQVLSPGGIVLLRTGEIGSNVRKSHVRSWGLGDHLYFLGERTIEAYAKRLGFDVIHRERRWLPATLYGREWFRMKGQSRIRNSLKTAIVSVPGALPILRWCMLNTKEAGNPIYDSTLVLRKARGQG